MAGTSVAIAALPVESGAADTLLSRWISLEDQAHAEKYRRPETKSGSLLAHAALRALLARRTAGLWWQFKYDSTGKLRVNLPGSALAVEGCLSHTKGMVACAISHIGPIGIDIETHRPRAYKGIARYGFGPAEQAAVARGGASAFYRIWTLREAMGKATGEGLAFATDRKDHIEATPEDGCWHSRHESGQAWGLAHYALEGGYSLALAIPGADQRWREEMIEWVDLLDGANEPASAPVSRQVS